MIRKTPYGVDIGLLGEESENPFPEEEVKTDKKRKASKKKTEATSEEKSEE